MGKTKRLDGQIAFRVDPAIKKKLEAIAADNHRRLADVVRLLCLRALEKFDVQKDRL